MTRAVDCALQLPLWFSQHGQISQRDALNVQDCYYNIMDTLCPDPYPK